MNVVYYRTVNGLQGYGCLPGDALLGPGSGGVASAGVTSCPPPPIVSYTPCSPMTVSLGCGVSAGSQGQLQSGTAGAFMPMMSAAGQLFQAAINPNQLQYLVRKRLDRGQRISRTVKCSTCDLVLNSEHQAKQHFNGKSHLRRMRQSRMPKEKRNQDGDEPDKKEEDAEDESKDAAAEDAIKPSSGEKRSSSTAENSERLKRVRRCASNSGYQDAQETRDAPRSASSASSSDASDQFIGSSDDAVSAAAIADVSSSGMDGSSCETSDAAAVKSNPTKKDASQESRSNAGKTSDRSIVNSSYSNAIRDSWKDSISTNSNALQRSNVACIRSKSVITSPATNACLPQLTSNPHNISFFFPGGIPPPSNSTCAQLPASLLLPQLPMLNVGGYSSGFLQNFCGYPQAGHVITNETEVGFISSNPDPGYSLSTFGKSAAVESAAAYQTFSKIQPDLFGLNRIFPGMETEQNPVLESMTFQQYNDTNRQITGHMVNDELKFSKNCLDSLLISKNSQSQYYQTTR